MFRIEEVRLGNYRSCVNTQVEFNTDLTALIGVNGAGKTNILMGLLLLKQLVSPSLRYSGGHKQINDMRRSSVEVLFGIDDRKLKISADLWFDSTQTVDSVIRADMKFRNLSVKGTRLTSVDSEALPFLHYASTHIEKFGSIRYRTARGLKKLDRDLIEFVQHMARMRYYSATQFSDPSRSPISIELDDSGAASRSGRLNSHEKFLHDLFGSKKTSPKLFQRYMNLVGSDGLHLVDAITFTTYAIPSSSIKVGPGGTVKTIKSKRTIVVPNFVVDKLELSPNQLSEGTFKTLALVFYILDEDTDILIIEEPEVCVHHGLLDSLIDLLKIQSNHKQILVSTHSDYVMDKLAPENVVVVRKMKLGTKATALNKTLPRTDLATLKKYLDETGNLGEYWTESGFVGG